LAFVINDKGYVCAGIENNTACSDFFEYDPSSDTWSQKRSISNISDESFDDNYTIIRNNAVAFVIDDKGYVATGTNNGLKSDAWEYDPIEDLWIQRTNFEGSTRIGAVAFSTSDNKRGFVATGRNGDNSNSYFDDIWELKPLDTYDKVN
jgi:N-acetylneuraminic acid mutarotase